MAKAKQRRAQAGARAGRRHSRQPWLVRPDTIRGLWIGFVAVLVALVLLNFAIHPEGGFGVDGSFGFFAWFGFASCVVLVVFSKVLGVFLKRNDGYYQEPPPAFLEDGTPSPHPQAPQAPASRDKGPGR